MAPSLVYDWLSTENTFHDQSSIPQDAHYGVHSTHEKVDHILWDTNTVSVSPEEYLQSLREKYSHNPQQLDKLDHIFIEKDHINIAWKMVSKQDVSIDSSCVDSVLCWLRKTMQLSLSTFTVAGVTYFSQEQALAIAKMQGVTVPLVDDWKYLLVSMPAYSYDPMKAYGELRTILNLSNAWWYDSLGVRKHDMGMSAYWASDVVGTKWSNIACVVKIGQSWGKGIPIHNSESGADFVHAYSKNLYPLRFILE